MSAVVATRMVRMTRDSHKGLGRLDSRRYCLSWARFPSWLRSRITLRLETILDCGYQYIRLYPAHSFHEMRQRLHS